MPQFGRRSKEQLSSCHPDLQKLFNEVIKHYDCTILEGHRSNEDQLKAFNAVNQESNQVVNITTHHLLRPM